MFHEGYVAGDLIGQNQFTFQTSHKGKAGVRIHNTGAQRLDYSVSVQLYNWSKHSACATGSTVQVYPKEDNVFSLPKVRSVYPKVDNLFTLQVQYKCTEAGL